MESLIAQEPHPETDAMREWRSFCLDENGVMLYLVERKGASSLEQRLRVAVRLLEKADPSEHCVTGCDYCRDISDQISALLPVLRGET